VHFFVNIMLSKISRIFYITLLSVIICPLISFAQTNNDSPVVIVTSYDPDVKTISDNLKPFTTEYGLRGCPNPIQLESMHCLNLSESVEWKYRMQSLLEKYYEDGNKPAAVVLLGNEAVSTFFSIDDQKYKDTPVVFGMRGDNMIKVTDDLSVDLTTWLPQSFALTKDFNDYTIAGGLVYQYDIDKNLDIIKALPQQIDTLAFISDNTFGGVTMLSHFKEKIESHPEYTVKYFDGRNLTVTELDHRLGQLGDKTAILVGTWRIDKSDTYALSNTTYLLAHSNPGVPAFSIASVGLGHWTIGGYEPMYQIQGGEMADFVADYLETGKQQPVTVINSRYAFDLEKTEVFGLNPEVISKEYRAINEKTSFFKENYLLILAYGAIVLFLITCLGIVAFALHRSRKLQQSLIKQSEELSEEREKAEKASQMKSQFIANISHEIRTPLNAVLGFSQMLTSSEMELSQQEKEEYGGYIMENSMQLTSLINDILDISRLDLNRQTYNIKSVDVVALIKVAVESAKSDLNGRLDIVFNSSASKIVIDTDRDKFYQVVTNILGNAKKYTQQGSITVDLTQTIADKGIRLSISDTGCGVPKENAELIFERFKQLDNSKQGVGLGLPIVRGIIEQLGGKVWLDSEYTDGARFVVTHPTKAKVVTKSDD